MAENGIFARSLIDDARVPVGEIMAGLEALGDAPLAFQPHISAIKHGVCDLLTTINNMLDAVHLDSVRPERSAFDIRACVDGAVNVLEDPTRITVDYAGPPTLVGDATHLRQMLVHMLRLTTGNVTLHARWAAGILTLSLNAVVPDRGLAAILGDRICRLLGGVVTRTVHGTEMTVRAPTPSSVRLQA
jgi:hypothetical protein